MLAAWAAPVSRSSPGQFSAVRQPAGPVGMAGPPADQVIGEQQDGRPGDGGARPRTIHATMPITCSSVVTCPEHPAHGHRRQGPILLPGRDLRLTSGPGGGWRCPGRAASRSGAVTMWPAATGARVEHLQPRDVPPRALQPRLSLSARHGLPPAPAGHAAAPGRRPERVPCPGACSRSLMPHRRPFPSGSGHPCWPPRRCGPAGWCPAPGRRAR